jgi:hypothetical protein
MDWKGIAERSRMASRRLRNARWRRAAVSLGSRAAFASPRKFRFAALGPDSRRIISRWVQRFRRCRPYRKRMGVDAHALCSLSRVPAIFVLSRLLREFFRRPTLRNERWFASHGCVHAAAVVSQLVPATLSIRLRDFPLRRTLRFKEPS